MKKILQMILFVMIFVAGGCSFLDDEPVVTADMRGGSIPVDKPADNSTDKPADKPANKPTAKPASEQIDSSKKISRL